MPVQILKSQVSFKDGDTTVKTNAFCFLPETADKLVDSVALFTHGFTSHKGSIFNWSLRLAEEGLPSLLFDLPGHYLGGFTEVSSFENFTNSAHHMFENALEVLQSHLMDNLSSEVNPADTTCILGGHSLGALLSLKACDLGAFKPFKKTQVIAVGFGLPPQGVTHIFDTPFYKSTLAVRAQLVSEAINPDKTFSWIKEEKEALSLSGKSIYLLTGEDDVVVGKDGTERLKDQLEGLGNDVVLEKPTKLAHHVPESAAPHLKKWLKDQGYFQK